VNLSCVLSRVLEASRALVNVVSGHWCVADWSSGSLPTLNAVAELPPSRRSAADGLDRRCLAVESATPDLRYFHVTTYAATLLFTVLVAAVSPFVFSWPQQQYLHSDHYSIILCTLLIIVCLIL